MANVPFLTIEDLQSYPRVAVREEWKDSPFAKHIDRKTAVISQEQLDALNNGPCNPQLALPVEKRSDMFLPGEQSVEIGYCAMPDGTGFVANRTFFPNATPEMFDWWINYQANDGAALAAWLPNAHLDSYTNEPYLQSDKCGISQKTRNWNKEHYASEGLMSLEESGYACLRFFSPQEFGVDMHVQLVSPVRSFILASALFYGDSLIMWGEETCKKLQAEDPDTKMPFNILMHVMTPVPGGIMMRSRFWIGKGLKDGVPYKTMPEGLDPEFFSWLMLRHTTQEMSQLASFLPEVYNYYQGKVE